MRNEVKGWVIGVKCAATFDGFVPRFTSVTARAVAKSTAESTTGLRYNVYLFSLESQSQKTWEERWSRYGDRVYEESVHDASADVTADSLERS